MGMFSSKSKKETKEKKKEQKKNSMVISKSDGSIFTTYKSSTTITRQISSSTRSETTYNETTTNTIPLLPLSDAIPFKGRPPRSAYCEPLTTSHPFERLQRTRVTVPNPSYNPPSQRLAPSNDDLKNKVTVKVEPSKRFYDTDSKVPAYRTRSKLRGYLLLINNIKFKTGEKERVGAELDETNLIALFEEIGFHIKRYRNLTKKQMENNIKMFRDQASLKKYDIVTVIVMSHGTGTSKGDNTQILSSDDLLLDTSWIIQQFDTSECSHLKEKPKIFIFQCCRGDNYNMVQTDSATTDSVCRQQSDMLIAYATVPGFVAHRDPNNGTWYMQAICQVFMEHAYDTDVENLLKIVDDKLKNLVSGLLTQTSSFENRGFKTCYLHPKLYE